MAARRSVLLNFIFVEQSLHRIRTSKANDRNTQLVPISLTVEIRALLDFMHPKKKWFVADVSGQPVGPILKGQAVQELIQLVVICSVM